MPDLSHVTVSFTIATGNGRNETRSRRSTTPTGLGRRDGSVVERDPLAARNPPHGEAFGEECLLEARARLGEVTPALVVNGHDDGLPERHRRPASPARIEGVAKRPREPEADASEMQDRRPDLEA